MVARSLPALILLAAFANPLIAQTEKLSPAQVEFFEKRIRPLFVQHCYRCHSQEAKKLGGKLYLDSRDGVLVGGRSGPALVPGKPKESLLIQSVRSEDKDVRMPRDGKLSAQEIADLETWVAMGAPDPRIGKTKLVPKRDEIDIEAGKRFWSFQPAKEISPPEVKDAEWAKHPIDRFVYAKLKEKSLEPVGLADRRTLIRRATFDLAGLPPTPAEIDSFLKDDSPDAFAKLVDRLLASAAYGERWGRHWLDVVRYADTAGDNSDYPIPQMYLYRNWVIDAFHRDMPYDQFIREQLAGDLLEKEEGGRRKDEKKPADSSFILHRSSLIATGYLANARRFGSYEDARYPWHLTIEDTIDNLGKTFLGLTIHCTRCHDHKFDPITNEDYYALYGFFSSTRYPWPGIELDKVQRDLVPLESKEAISKKMAGRKMELAELDAAIKKLEADKTSADKIKKLKSERDLLAKQPLPYATAYAVIDGPSEPKKRIGQVGNVKVQLKGDPDRLGKEVPRRFPLVLGGQMLAPEVKGSGRLELANWIADAANPLTARVMVNRIWQYHFGSGLVPTANDFGKQGQAPTHPELLDFLARQFSSPGMSAAIPGGKAWSIKSMHRLIMLSRTYQLASTDEDANLKADPSNAYHWRYSRHRLDAESIRDSLLAVSGNLDRTRGGAHPFPEQPAWNYTQHKPFKAVYDTNRRSVYLMTPRIHRHPFLGLFDGADANQSHAGRTTTTTPLQALFLMNDPFVHEQAKKFAVRLLAEKEATRVESAFVLAFGRPPSADETKQAHDFLAAATERLSKSGVAADQQPPRAWESFARVLFMSNEFVYVN